MIYRKLGRSDLSVSALCLGTMTWGEQNTEQEAHDQIDLALSRGINFVDTAEMYPIPPKPETFGRSEEILGAWLSKNKSKRKNLIISTKVLGRGNAIPHVRNGARLDEKNIRAAVDASLERLQTNYIDLYQSHSPDRPTNHFGQLDYRHVPNADQGACIAETLEVMAMLVQEGKIRHFGVSNETPWGIMQHLKSADAGTGPRLVSIQNAYNLLNRIFDIGMAEIAIKEKVGLITYSPLGMGKLTGKYLNGKRPADGRLTRFERSRRYSTPRADSAVAEYVAIARLAGIDPAHMALAFVVGQKPVTSTIIGATSLKQLEFNIEAIRIELTTEVASAINRVHSENPNPCP